MATDRHGAAMLRTPPALMWESPTTAQQQAMAPTGATVGKTQTAEATSADPRRTRPC